MSKARSVAEAIKQGLEEATGPDLLSRVEAVEVLEEVQRYIEELLEEILSGGDDDDDQPGAEEVNGES